MASIWQFDGPLGCFTQKMINKFHAFVSNIKQQSQSSASANDSLNQALYLYSEGQKVVFKHLQFYNILVIKKQARSISSKAPVLSGVASNPTIQLEGNNPGSWINSLQKMWLGRTKSHFLTGSN
ncbi:hypothetical protein VP01_359g1 [Puccinia sorghi]|uniref:Uncharacterized protein n=1 Tax=Puccinia sorghi TaxID=27349 RepID=A0A0L6UV72_9BASI|nr:hypothetical protein VP01_359g1 [Puccinia sorghi]